MKNIEYQLNKANQINKKTKYDVILIDLANMIEFRFVIIIIIIIMNLTADQSCSHAVSMSNKHAKKFERSKNSHLNLLYTHCNLSAICNNYLASAASTSLDLSSLNSC